MFKKSKNKAKSIRIDTLIGEQTHLMGDINFKGGLRIDGKVKGNVSATQDINSILTISEQGSVEGEIKVPNLIVDGSVIGDVYVSGHVELASKAKVHGNVYYRLLEMAMGTEVNGQLIHVTEANEAALLAQNKENRHEDDTAAIVHQSNLD